VAATPARVLGALILVQAIFSTLHVVGKIVLRDLAPLALAGTRVAIATPLLLAIAWRHDRTVPARADWPRLALLGFLGIMANQTLFLLGLSFTTATSAAILMPSIPVFTAGVAALAGIERVRGARLAGVLLAAAGALVLLDPARLETSGRATLGNLLVLSNCLCYAFFLVLQRPLFERVPWRTVIAWSFLFGSIGTLALSAPALAATPWSGLPASALAGTLYIGLVPTAGAFALNTWAVRRSSPAMAAAFTTLQPVLTGALAALALGEAVRGHQAIGFLLIVAGLALVQRDAARRPTAPGADIASVPEVE
jgi:drug/metabolite transporter (DMT)-like permease